MCLRHQRLNLTAWLTLLFVSLQVLPRSVAGTLWWRGTPTPSLRSACQTQPAASLATTPSTYSETRWTLTCRGPASSSACPSPPCGTGVLTRYCDEMAHFLTTKSWGNKIQRQPNSLKGEFAQMFSHSVKMRGRACAPTSDGKTPFVATVKISPDKMV